MILLLLFFNLQTSFIIGWTTTFTVCLPHNRLLDSISISFFSGVLTCYFIWNILFCLFILAISLFVSVYGWIFYIPWFWNSGLITRCFVGASAQSSPIVTRARYSRSVPCVGCMCPPVLVGLWLLWAHQWVWLTLSWLAVGTSHDFSEAIMWWLDPQTWHHFNRVLVPAVAACQMCQLWSHLDGGLMQSQACCLVCHIWSHFGESLVQDKAAHWSCQVWRHLRATTVWADTVYWLVGTTMRDECSRHLCQAWGSLEGNTMWAKAWPPLVASWRALGKGYDVSWSWPQCIPGLRPLNRRDSVSWGQLPFMWSLRAFGRDCDTCWGWMLFVWRVWSHWKRLWPSKQFGWGGV